MTLWLAWLLACGGGTTGPPQTGAPTGTTSTGTTDTATVTTDTGTPPTAGLPVTVAAGGVQTCADPSLRASLGRFQRVLGPSEPDKDVWFWGGGVIAGDFNGDRLPDLILPGYRDTFLFTSDANGELQNQSGLLAGLPVDWASGGSAADYDGDGDLDVLITRYLFPDTLLENVGDGFRDVTSEAGLSPAFHRTMGSAWGDYDGDGDLDLVTGAYGFLDQSGVSHEDFLPADPAHLYVNNGDGSFTERSDTLPPEVHDGYTFVVSWLDMNLDGLPELYVVNDFGEAYPNRLLWNDGGGQLRLDNNALGLDAVMTGMGLGIGDINDDGEIDFVMPEWNGVRVRESSSIGVWVESSFARGVYNDIGRDQKVGWGADLADFDNDGDLEIPMAFGDLETDIYDSPASQPDAFFDQDLLGTYQDVGPDWGLDDDLDGRGFAVVDLDQDGWLDLVKRDLSGPSVLYRARCGAESWVRIRLVQTGLNVHAIGARVRLWSGGKRQVRWLQAGGHNHATGVPPELHFGLGDTDRIDRIEVVWPDGQISNVWELEGRQELVLTRQ